MKYPFYLFKSFILSQLCQCFVSLLALSIFFQMNFINFYWHLCLFPHIAKSFTLDKYDFNYLKFLRHEKSKQSRILLRRSLSQFLSNKYDFIGWYLILCVYFPSHTWVITANIGDPRFMFNLNSYRTGRCAHYQNVKSTENGNANARKQRRPREYQSQNHI